MTLIISLFFFKVMLSNRIYYIHSVSVPVKTGYLHYRFVIITTFISALSNHINGYNT